VKIAIASLGSCGDVYPSIALGQGFRNVGLETNIIAHKMFEPVVRRQGLLFSPVNALYRQSLAIHPNSIYPAKALDTFRLLTLKKRRVAPIMDSIVNDLEHAIRDADLVLYNMLSLPVHYLAKQIGIKAYPICLQPLGRTNEFPIPIIFSHLKVPCAFYSLTYRVAEKCMAYFLSSTRQFKKKIFCRDCFDEIYSRHIPVLHGFSRHIVPRPTDWGENMHITGYWFHDPGGEWVPPDDLKDFIDEGPAPVCVGFGSMNDLDIKTVIETVVKGVLDAGQRVILLTGWSGLESQFRPSSNLYPAKDIPHSWLFQRVSAVIHHGGAGTVGAALRAGVPSIVIPFFFDQRFWAKQLVKQGVGLPPIPKKHLKRQRITFAVRNVLGNGVFRERLKRLRDQVNSENGVKNAVTLILNGL
jgi:sterol 3beta-glucosyltransferase